MWNERLCFGGVSQSRQQRGLAGKHSFSVPHWVCLRENYSSWNIYKKLELRSQIDIWRFPKNRGTPSHHPFIRIFPYKPSSYWGKPHDCGNLHSWVPLKGKAPGCRPFAECPDPLDLGDWFSDHFDLEFQWTRQHKCHDFVCLHIMKRIFNIHQTLFDFETSCLKLRWIICSVSVCFWSSEIERQFSFKTLDLGCLNQGQRWVLWGSFDAAGGTDLDAPANTARWICTRALRLRSGPGRSGEMPMISVCPLWGALMWQYLSNYLSLLSYLSISIYIYIYIYI